MPSYRTDPRQRTQAKKWHARAKRQGVEWSLGYYATREEAVEVEESFAEGYPRTINRRGQHQKAS